MESNTHNQDLLKIKEVQEEIKRHLWIESERVGHDIGYERAAEDWLKRYSQEWIKYHMPDRLAQSKKASAQKPTPLSSKAAVKGRRAKSYYSGS